VVKTELRTHVTKKTMEQYIKGNIAQVSTERKHTIHKMLTTVKSPVKVSMDSGQLTHSKVTEF